MLQFIFLLYLKMEEEPDTFDPVYQMMATFDANA